MRSKAQELLVTAAEAAAAGFREDGRILPKILMENAEGVRLLVSLALTDKDDAAKVMRQSLREWRAVRYAFETEAWTVDPRKGGDTEQAFDMQRRGISLEHHPDRMEIVSIHVEDKLTKEYLVRFYHILRPEHGKPTLAPPDDIEVDGGAGRFHNMFD